MIRWVAFSVLVVALAAGIAAISMYTTTSEKPNVADLIPVKSAPTGPPGAIEIVGGPTYNFGVLSQKTEGSHDWVVKNTGGGPVELMMGETSCSCTIGSMKEGKTAKIEPGKETTITLSWNTKEFSNKYRQFAKIRVMNDPNTTEVELAVEGMVHPPVSIYPPETQIIFGSVPNDKTVDRTFAVYSLDRPDLKITSFKTSNPSLFDVKIEPLNEEDRKSIKAEKGGRKVTLTAKPGQQLGYFTEEVQIETDHPQGAPIKMPVSGKIVGPISTVPERIRVLDVDSSQGATHAVTMWVKGKSDTKFVVEKKPDAVDVEIVPAGKAEVGNAMKYQLVIKVHAGTRTGVSISDDIVLKTDHPHAGIVKIPVYIQISRRRN